MLPWIDWISQQLWLSVVLENEGQRQFINWVYMGVSENVVYPIVPNGFADHYPYEKWLFHWEYTHIYPTFSDKPI